MIDMGSYVQPDFIPDFDAIRELRVEAEAIEATYGSNPYSAYLRKHGRRPSKEEAAGIGRILGGRVRADDGTMQPLLRPPIKL